MIEALLQVHNDFHLQAAVAEITVDGSLGPEGDDGVNVSPHVQASIAIEQAFPHPEKLDWSFVKKFLPYHFCPPPTFEEGPIMVEIEEMRKENSSLAHFFLHFMGLMMVPVDTVRQYLKDFTPEEVLVPREDIIELDGISYIIWTPLSALDLKDSDGISRCAVSNIHWYKLMTYSASTIICYIFSKLKQGIDQLPLEEYDLPRSPISAWEDLIENFASSNPGAWKAWAQHTSPNASYCPSLNEEGIKQMRAYLAAADWEIPSRFVCGQPSCRSKDTQGNPRSLGFRLPGSLLAHQISFHQLGSDMRHGFIPAVAKSSCNSARAVCYYGCPDCLGLGHKHFSRANKLSEHRRTCLKKNLGNAFCLFCFQIVSGGLPRHYKKYHPSRWRYDTNVECLLCPAASGVRQGFLPNQILHLKEEHKIDFARQRGVFFPSYFRYISHPHPSPV